MRSWRWCKLLIVLPFGFNLVFLSIFIASEVIFEVGCQKLKARGLIFQFYILLK